MAYNPCISEIANNIAINCASPIVGGYTGRAVLIPYASNPAFTQDSQNPRIVSAITLGDSAKVVVVDNIFAEPFSGSQTASSADSGRAQYTKTIAMRLPQRGAGYSKDVIEPLVNSAEGFCAVLEKKDKVGDGSFEIVGFLQPLKATADSISRDENANGGDWSITLTCVEGWAEVTLFDTDYATSKEAFEALLAKAF